jgi:hypothetical protein
VSLSEKLSQELENMLNWILTCQVMMKIWSVNVSPACRDPTKDTNSAYAQKLAPETVVGTTSIRSRYQSLKDKTQHQDKNLCIGTLLIPYNARKKEPYVHNWSIVAA